MQRQARSRAILTASQAASCHEPILITGKKANAVLISLYLRSIPGMRESIRKGLRTPVSECSTELEW